MYKTLFTAFVISLATLQCTAQNSPKNDSSTKVQSNLTSDDDIDRIFNRAEKQPEFSGGEAMWHEYLQTNINMNVAAKNGASAGTYKVIIRFVVGRDSTLRDFAAETGFGYGMEDEVIRVLKQSPKWNPAMVNGYKVSFYLRQPITFVVKVK